MKRPSRLLELPVTERRNANPRSLTGRAERALGWPGVGLVGFLGAGIVFTILGIVAWLTRLPWVFPSLAPTIVLMFETPLRPQASPRNAVVGHLVGIAVGYGTLATFGLTTTGSITQVGMSLPRIAAASIAVATTTLLLNSIAMPHPPASSSTLIVSLGLLHHPGQLVIMSAAILTGTSICWLLNTVSGVTVPPWPPHPHNSGPGPIPEQSH